MVRQFLTVAEELLEHARCMAAFLEDGGYAIKVEPREIGYPYAPTLRARRGLTTLFIEVCSAIQDERVQAWVGYAKSSGRDTRIALGMPQDAQRSGADASRLRDLGVGLYLSDGIRIEEAVAPHDLALNVQLPELGTLPKKVRRVLGPVYDQFNRSQWRDGFADACQTVEALSRQYLKNGIAAGRITLITEKGRPRTLSPEQIDKLTLGGLANAFQQITNRNYSDNKIATVLKGVNKDRVGVSHHKAKSATEARLRKNVGKHMWTIVDVLKELLGIK